MTQPGLESHQPPRFFSKTLIVQNDIKQCDIKLGTSLKFFFKPCTTPHPYVVEYVTKLKFRVEKLHGAMHATTKHGTHTATVFAAFAAVGPPAD